MGVNAYGISLAITTGIAPLLFVQLLYQQYFYTATILIGWAWLLFVVLLMLGYYAAYAYKFRGAPARGGGGTGWLVGFRRDVPAHRHGPRGGQPDPLPAGALGALCAEPLVDPRRSGLLSAPAALRAGRESGFSALMAAWWAVRQAGAGRDVRANTEIARFAWTLGAVDHAAADRGRLLLLLALPRPVLLGLMRGGAATLVPLTLSILLGLGLLMMLARVSDPVEKRGTVTGTLAAMVLTVAVMALTRHQVREIYLEPVTARGTGWPSRRSGATSCCSLCCWWQGWPPWPSWCGGCWTARPAETTPPRSIRYLRFPRRPRSVVRRARSPRRRCVCSDSLRLSLALDDDVSGSLTKGPAETDRCRRGPARLPGPTARDAARVPWSPRGEPGPTSVRRARACAGARRGTAGPTGV